MYVCMYVCMHVLTILSHVKDLAYMFMHVCMYACICLRFIVICEDTAYTYIYTHIYIYMSVHVLAMTCESILHPCNMHVCMYACMYVCMYVLEILSLV